MNYKQKKGFNQMMSILMLGLISAGGGVGVATFAQDQQGGLTQTTGGAGLREAVTIENVLLDSFSAIIVIRNTGTVDVAIGSIYFDGKLLQLITTAEEIASDDDPDVIADVESDFSGDEANLVPGDSVTVSATTALSSDPGTQHEIKVTTEGGGVVTTQATAPQ